MKKLTPLIALFLLFIGCGNEQSSNQGYVNSPKSILVADLVKEISQDGIKGDPTSLMDGTYSMYHIIPSFNYFLIEHDSRKILFEKASFSVVGWDLIAPFDPIKYKYYATPFVTDPYQNDNIENFKTFCATSGKKYFETSVPNGTIIYNNYFDLSVNYEVVKEDNISNLKIIESGKEYHHCCADNKDECGLDLTGSVKQNITKFLIAAFNEKGFILKAYDSKGQVAENDILAFLKQ